MDTLRDVTIAMLLFSIWLGWTIVPEKVGERAAQITKAFQAEMRK